MNVLRLCSPVIAAGVIGVVLSAPAVFARPQDATVADNQHCADVLGNLSSAAHSGDVCFRAPAGSGRGGRPQ